MTDCQMTTVRSPMGEVKVRLVVMETSTQHSQDMLAAKHQCEQYRCNGLLSEWISEEDCFKLSDFTQKDLFVLEEFSGELFERLSQTKAVVVGPKCLSYCLTDGCEIPPGPYPIFTIAMKGLVVTISGLDNEEKAKYKTNIFWMGGRCESMLTNETTHLISNTIFSDKYNKAISLSLPIMRPNWVQAAWEASLVKNISATNSEFDNCKLPIFYDVLMCTSGIDKREKKKLEKLIKSNGGKYSGDFESTTIKVLIVNQNGIGSDKHKAAIEYDKICVSPSWIYESIEAGHALNVKNFAIANSTIPLQKTSSPNKSTLLPDMSLNVSTIKNLRNNYVDDTCSTTTSDSLMQPSSLQSASCISVSQKGRHGRLVGPAKEFAQLIDSIDMKEAKQAGSFLDGCCIYAYGMSAARRDRVQRVVSRAGGVRYDEPSEAVTHLICGDPSVALTEDHLSCMPRAIAVTVRWLIDSMHAGRTVDEALYLVSNSDVTSNASSKLRLTKASPMSKRNLQLLQSPSCRPPVPLFSLNESPEKNNDIVQHYRDQHSKTQESLTLCDNATQRSQNDSDATVIPIDALPNGTVDDDKTVAVDENDGMEDQVLFFDGLTFELQHIEDETEEIIEHISNSGGTVVEQDESAFKNYIVVPIICNDRIDNTDSEAEVITINWLIDCASNEALVPIEYYHRPIVSNLDSEPLSGLVLTISTYAGNERSFLSEVAQILGAIVQPSLNRRETSTTKRSTHLICSEPSGAKYMGAVSWGLPVVTNEWLLDCLAAGQRLREKSYLLGDSVEPKWDEDCDKTKSTTSNSICDQDSKATIDPSKTCNGVSIQQLKSAKKCTRVLPNSITKTGKVEEIAEVNMPSISQASSRNNTPKRKLSSSLDVSLASKYIAMARQGAFTADSQETPKKSSQDDVQLSEPNDTVSTPPLDNALSTPNLALFSTASKRRMLAIKRGERASNPLHTPKNIFEISSSTPDSPFGAILRPDTGKMSAQSRKKLMKVCDQIPSPISRQETRSETPLSELRHRFFSNQLNHEPLNRVLVPKQLDINTDFATPPKRKLSAEPVSNASNGSGNEDLQNQLKHLDMVLTGGENISGASTPRSAKRKRTSTLNPNTIENVDSAVCVESQVDTVGWDDMTEPKNAIAVPKTYKFMLSGNVANCDEIKQIIERLGGIVSGQELDLTATHFICQTLARSEKLIGCLASRKWIVHPDYIIRSQEAGRFVDEELYEWGNPMSKISTLGTEQDLANAIYRCRSKRDLCPLPFSTFNVVLSMQETRKRSILRVLQAGGGKVLDVSPPFSGEINATHCFVEQNRLPLSQADMKYMAARNIPVCQPVFLNHYLVNDPPPDAMDHAYIEYKQYLPK